MRHCVIGVDLGGTNVRARALFSDGTIGGESFSIPSNAQQGTDAILQAVCDVVERARGDLAVDAVGLAIPGHVDNQAGIVRWAPNFGETINGVFRYWKNVPIREPLQARLRIPILMGNDANLAALGEFKYGSGRTYGARCLVMLTLGTGIGGGVVMTPEAVDGDARSPLVLVGANGGGAELGHIIINAQGQECNAGTFGALEAYCGRDAIVTRAQHRILRHRASLIEEMVQGDLGRITPKTISDAANEGDELAIEVLEEVGRMLGIGIGNFINIFAPDVLAIGGNVAQARDWIMKPAIREARNVAVVSLFEDCRIVEAEQLHEAGILGGAAMAAEHLHRLMLQA